jgi:Mg2+ and Co2+ transporter CorA
MMAHDGHILLVLHEVPQFSDSTRKGLLFWRRPNGEWQCNLDGEGLEELKGLVQRYARRVDELEEAYDKSNGVRSLFLVLRGIAPMIRATKHVHEVLQGARENVREDRDIINLRDVAGEVERAAELLNLEARTALDFDIAEHAEAQAQVNARLAVLGQRLNVLAGIFLPMTALASVFGMNLLSGLETVASPFLFWAVLVIGSVLGVAVWMGVQEKTEAVGSRSIPTP